MRICILYLKIYENYKKANISLKNRGIQWINKPSKIDYGLISLTRIIVPWLIGNRV